MEATNNSPIFIVGAGRSGTTLLTSLLSAHSRITIPPETHFLKRADQNGAVDAAPADFERFWSELTTWSRFLDLEIDAAAARAAIEARGDHRFQTVFDVLLQEYARKEQKPRVGEKTPGHWNYLPTLLKWYPQGRIIVIQRDPRAVVASQLKCPWVRVTDRTLRHGVFVDSRVNQIAFYAHSWQQAYEHVIPPFLADPRVRLVRYETLVQDVEGTMRELFTFLDEAWEPTVVTHRSGAKAAVHTGESGRYGADFKGWVSEHHDKTRKPITTESLEKWKEELAPAEVAIVESYCHRGMATAVYPLHMPPWRQRAGRVWSGIEGTCQVLERGARQTLRRWRTPRRPAPAVG